MRRGLMAWDPDELPKPTLENRLTRLQASMAEARQDAMLIYTSFIRSGAVSYLTAFSPYWADGILMVPRDGEPLLAAPLSKRMGAWIRTVKPLGDLVTSPMPGKILGEKLAAIPDVRRIAIVEREAFPEGHYEPIAAALPNAEIVEGGEVFARARAQLDDAERALFARSDAIARHALDDRETLAVQTVGEAVGAAERRARREGAEEIYVAIASDLDADQRFLRLSGARTLGRRYAIRVSVAYKGVWVRRIRIYTRNDTDLASLCRADEWFARLTGELDPQRPLEAQIRFALARLQGAQLYSWTAEAPMGTHPLWPVASSSASAAEHLHIPLLVLTIRLELDGMIWCGAGITGHSA
jgi:Creatinase/Prolidase N-terminal domain